MNLNKIDYDVRPLSENEMRQITGGETFWYWVFYTVGYTGRLIEDYGKGVNWASKTMPGLR